MCTTALLEKMNK